MTENFAVHSSSLHHSRHVYQGGANLLEEKKQNKKNPCIFISLLTLRLTSLHFILRSTAKIPYCQPPLCVIWPRQAAPIKSLCLPEGHIPVTAHKQQSNGNQCVALSGCFSNGRPFYRGLIARRLDKGFQGASTDPAKKKKKEGRHTLT